MCLRVYVSVTSRCFFEMDRLIWFLACRLLSTRHALHYKEIQIYEKLGHFPLEAGGLWKTRMQPALSRTEYVNLAQKWLSHSFIQFNNIYN